MPAELIAKVRAEREADSKRQGDWKEGLKPSYADELSRSQDRMSSFKDKCANALFAAYLLNGSVLRQRMELQAEADKHWDGHQVRIRAEFEC